jgi:hypothetical protein
MAPSFVCFGSSIIMSLYLIFLMMFFKLFLQRNQKVYMPYLLMEKFEEFVLYLETKDLKEAFIDGFKINEDKDDEILAFKMAYGDSDPILKQACVLRESNICTMLN